MDSVAPGNHAVKQAAVITHPRGPAAAPITLTYESDTCERCGADARFVAIEPVRTGSQPAEWLCGRCRVNRADGETNARFWRRLAQATERSRRRQ